jgi:hypothetical protein
MVTDTQTETMTVPVTVTETFTTTTTETMLIRQMNWEWINPLPQGNTLFGVWGSSSTDVYAVGMAGTILHYDGTSWSLMDSGCPWFIGNIALGSHHGHSSSDEDDAIYMAINYIDNALGVNVKTS